MLKFCLYFQLFVYLINAKILLSKSILVRMLQREARGSVTFKIVPSYRSAPPPCEVQVSPKTQIHSQNTDASNKPISPVNSTGASSGGITNKSEKSVNTSMAAAGKEKTPKKSPKSKSSSSSSENVPKRRLNPLSALRSRKS